MDNPNPENPVLTYEFQFEVPKHRQPKILMDGKPLHMTPHYYQPSVADFMEKSDIAILERLVGFCKRYFNDGNPVVCSQEHMASMLYLLSRKVVITVTYCGEEPFERYVPPLDDLKKWANRNGIKLHSPTSGSCIKDMDIEITIPNFSEGQMLARIHQNTLSIADDTPEIWDLISKPHELSSSVLSKNRMRGKLTELRWIGDVQNQIMDHSSQSGIYVFETLVDFHEFIHPPRTKRKPRL